MINKRPEKEQTKYSSDKKNSFSCFHINYFPGVGWIFGRHLPACSSIIWNYYNMLTFIMSIYLWLRNSFVYTRTKQEISGQRTQVSKFPRWKDANVTVLTGQHVLSKQCNLAVSFFVRTMWFSIRTDRKKKSFSCIHINFFPGVWVDFWKTPTCVFFW